MLIFAVRNAAGGKFDCICHKNQQLFLVLFIMTLNRWLLVVGDAGEMCVKLPQNHR